MKIVHKYSISLFLGLFITPLTAYSGISADIKACEIALKRQSRYPSTISIESFSNYFLGDDYIIEGTFTGKNPHGEIVEKVFYCYYGTKKKLKQVEIKW